jgi:hypothetical protein
MRQEDGLIDYGKNLIDAFYENYKNNFSDLGLKVLTDRHKFLAYRDYCNCKLINDNIEYKNVAIIGNNLPLVYLKNLNAKHIKVIDENIILKLIQKEHDFELVYSNPLFEDITEHLKDVDLVIYPNTEALVPFDMLKYRHTKVNALVSNFSFAYFKVINNIAYSIEDLIDITEMSNIIDSKIISLYFNDLEKKSFSILGSYN